MKNYKSIVRDMVYRKSYTDVWNNSRINVLNNVWRNVNDNVERTVRTNVNIAVSDKVYCRYKPFQYNDLGQYKDNV